MSKVLYLEDTSDQRDLVVMILGTIGIEVEVAADGQAGLEKVEAAPPDLILLDLGMPKLDGFEFMAILKDRPETRDIPIVVISAWTAARHREKAMASGAEAFISKPYEIDDLIKAVQKHLSST